MIAPRSLLLALLSAPFMVSAQNANPFKIPSSGLSATAGQPLKLSWNPTTQGSVTLVLRSGSSNDLAEGTVIASSIDNSGSYTWTPASSITRGSDYTVEIIDDSDPSQTNYTPYFYLDSDTTSAYSTSQVTLGAASATSALSTASPTGSAAALLSTLSSSSVAASSAAASSSASASASSASASALGTSAASTTMAGASSSASGSATGLVTDTSSMTGSVASTMVSTASSSFAGASFVSTASASASAEAQSVNAAPRATAMAGMLGVAALGVFAL